MKSLVTIIAAICVFVGSSALAQVQVSDVHPELDAVLSRGAITTNETEWRYLVTMTSDDGVMVGRFDGTLAEGERWQLLSPTLEDLSDLQEGMWSGLQESGDGEDTEGGGLFFSTDDSDIVPGSLRLAEDGESRLVFSFQPQMDEDEMEMGEHIRGALTVSRDPLAITRLRMWAPEGFKPHFAVRLHTFDMVQDYVQLDGLPAPVLTNLSQEISGSAAFQSFDQSFELAFTEIEYLGSAEQAR